MEFIGNVCNHFLLDETVNWFIIKSITASCLCMLVSGVIYSYASHVHFINALAIFVFFMALLMFLGFIVRMISRCYDSVKYVRNNPRRIKYAQEMTLLKVNASVQQTSTTPPSKA